MSLETGDSSSAASGVHPRAFGTIVFGGLLAGVLDAVDAVVFFGAAPIRIAQHIASGILGPGSFQGGWTTGALGIALHFVIAFGAAAVYFAASLRLPVMMRRPVLCGLVFGVAAFFFMNYAVVPLSAVAVPKTPRPFQVSAFLNGVIGHALLVGLPIALIASRSARTQR